MNEAQIKICIEQLDDPEAQVKNGAAELLSRALNGPEAEEARDIAATLRGRPLDSLARASTAPDPQIRNAAIGFLEPALSSMVGDEMIPSEERQQAVDRVRLLPELSQDLEAKIVNVAMGDEDNRLRMAAFVVTLLKGREEHLGHVVRNLGELYFTIRGDGELEDIYERYQEAILVFLCGREGLKSEHEAVRLQAARRLFASSAVISVRGQARPYTLMRRAARGELLDVVHQDPDFLVRLAAAGALLQHALVCGVADGGVDRVDPRALEAAVSAYLNAKVEGGMLLQFEGFPEEVELALRAFCEILTQVADDMCSRALRKAAVDVWLSMGLSLPLLWLIRGAYEEAKEAADASLVMTIGVTQAGKSTTINCLALPEGSMEMLQDPWIGKEYLVPGRAVAAPVEAGHQSSSKTLFPQIVSAEDAPFAYCDLAGFEDSRKGNPAICAALSIPLTIAFGRQLQGVLVVLDWRSFLVARGSGFREVLQTLAGIFNNPEALLAVKPSPVLFVITRAEKGKPKHQVMTQIKALYQTITTTGRQEKQELINKNEDLEPAIASVEAELADMDETNPLRDQRQAKLDRLRGECHKNTEEIFRIAAMEKVLALMIASEASIFLCRGEAQQIRLLKARLRQLAEQEAKINVERDIQPVEKYGEFRQFYNELNQHAERLGEVFSKWLEGFHRLQGALKNIAELKQALTNNQEELAILKNQALDPKEAVEELLVNHRKSIRTKNVQLERLYKDREELMVEQGRSQERLNSLNRNNLVDAEITDSVKDHRLYWLFGAGLATRTNHTWNGSYAFEGRPIPIEKLVATCSVDKDWNLLWGLNEVTFSGREPLMTPGYLPQGGRVTGKFSAWVLEPGKYAVTYQSDRGEHGYAALKVMVEKKNKRENQKSIRLLEQKIAGLTKKIQELDDGDPAAGKAGILGLEHDKKLAEDAKLIQETKKTEIQNRDQRIEELVTNIQKTERDLERAKLILPEYKSCVIEQQRIAQRQVVWADMLVDIDHVLKFPQNEGEHFSDLARAFEESQACQLEFDQVLSEANQLLPSPPSVSALGAFAAIPAAAVVAVPNIPAAIPQQAS